MFRILKFSGLQDPDPPAEVPYPADSDPSFITQKYSRKKALDFCCFMTSSSHWHQEPTVARRGGGGIPTTATKRGLSYAFVFHSLT